MIRIDAAWLATAPLGMRAGNDTALARVIAVFGAARPHHAYLFANKRANRIKALDYSLRRWTVLTRLPTHRASRIEELLPHRWQIPNS